MFLSVILAVIFLSEVPSKNHHNHICEDSTHTTCDSHCSCDGLGCHNTVPNWKLWLN